MYADDVLVVDLRADMLCVAEAYVSRWKIEFSSRKGKVMVVGKREVGVTRKIGEEIVEEIEEFKYVG